MRCNFVDPSTGLTHQEIIDDLQQELAGQASHIYELTKALQESVLLQAHHAELLNMHDGGKRRIFKSVDEWLARMKVEKREKEGQS